MRSQLAFVSTDESGKVQPAARRLIRQHCMQKKNKQWGSRRSRRENARIEAGKWLKAEAEARNKDICPQQGTPAHCQSMPTAISKPVGGHQRQFTMTGVDLPLLPSPSGWGLFTFAGELDIPCQRLLHQYFIINPIRDSLFSFKHFGIKTNIDTDPFWCFRLIVSQELCLHAILLLASASNDIFSQKALSKPSYQHLQRVLPLLNQRLSDPDAYRDDMVLYVIGILASITILFQDYVSAQVHAAGISKMMQLRRNISGEAERASMIPLSVDRLNFCCSLVTDLWAPAYGGLACYEPVVPLEIVQLHNSRNMLQLDGFIDPELATVFRNLQYLSILLNDHYSMKTALDGTALQDYLKYIQSSLINPRNRPLGDFEECIRLGMTTFLATTFRLPGSYTHPCCKRVAEKLRACYATTRTGVYEMPQMVETWLLFVCLIATEDKKNILESMQIRTSWKRSRSYIASWEETRQVLRQVMWIDAFHDELGRKAFGSFLSST